MVTRRRRWSPWPRRTNQSQIAPNFLQDNHTSRDSAQHEIGPPFGNPDNRAPSRIDLPRLEQRSQVLGHKPDDELEIYTWTELKTGNCLTICIMFEAFGWGPGRPRVSFPIAKNDRFLLWISVTRIRSSSVKPWRTTSPQSGLTLPCMISKIKSQYQDVSRAKTYVKLADGVLRGELAVALRVDSILSFDTDHGDQDHGQCQGRHRGGNSWFLLHHFHWFYFISIFYCFVLIWEIDEFWAERMSVLPK